MSPPPPTRYRIDVLDPRAHLFEVSVTVSSPDPAGQRLSLPTWIPGSYLIREFARNFVRVTARCDDGPVSIGKESKNTWRAVPCRGELIVMAHVYAYDLSVRTAYLDGSRGYFNGASVFLCPEGREDAPCTLEIVAPRDAGAASWRVATAMISDGATPYGFGNYRAANYDELIDHPVEMADFTLASFSAGGVPHDIAISGQHNADLGQLTADLTRICQWQIDLFGGRPGSSAPFSRYLFLVIAVGEGYGGLEHRASTSLICRRDELPRPGAGDHRSDDYIKFLGLASHEYFHAWNVKRIKPAAFVPYDLMQENYTRQLWAFEGFTSYYDDLTLVRSGVISVAQYLELIGRAMTTVLRNPGRHGQSVAESSFDAWIKYYRQDENSPNAIVSYYVKGSMVGLALDLTLRSDGKSSLDDLMRALWQRYGQTGVGVPENGIAALASELAGRDLSDFFARYVGGTEDLALAELLAAFGVELGIRATSGTKDSGGKDAPRTARASLGARLGADLKLQVAYVGGAASRAGLSAGDTLIAVDGLKASPDALAQMLEHAEPGTVIDVHAFRRDELLHVAVTLDAAPLDTVFLGIAEPENDANSQRRREWLGMAE